MIAATIHDPCVFAKAADQDCGNAALAMDLLARAAHGHLLIVDDAGVLSKSLLQAIQQLPPRLMKRVEAALAPNRIIRIHAAAAKHAEYEALLQRSSTATALAINSGAVDALITDADGKGCAELVGQGEARNVYTIPEFLLSPCHQRILETMGGVGTSGMARQEFGENIALPVLRWAKHVQIVDRHVISAMYDDDPDNMDADDQWGRMRATLRFLYESWETSCAVKHDAFSIITQPYRKSRWGHMPWHGAEYPSPKRQAEQLAESLDLGERAQVRLIRVPESLRDVEHDRYLVTDREVILSFSRGFDLIRPNGHLIECTVSLYHHGPRDSVLSLLQQSRTLVHCRLHLDGWRAE